MFDSLEDINRSLTLQISSVFINAVLHYVLYRIAVSLILMIKETIVWTLFKTEGLFDGTARKSSVRKSNTEVDDNTATDE